MLFEKDINPTLQSESNKKEAINILALNSEWSLDGKSNATVNNTEQREQSNDPQIGMIDSASKNKPPKNKTP